MSCCTDIRVETNSTHRKIQPKIWGTYRLTNKTYTDIRADIVTYVNGHGLPLFGGKGKLFWRVEFLFISL